MSFALCALLFHFANAPLLPPVGQKLALQFPKEATAMMSFCVVAQGVMPPIAILVGRRADAWGRKADLPHRVRRFYFKVGLPLTVVTFAAGTPWLSWR